MTLALRGGITSDQKKVVGKACVEISHFPYTIGLASGSLSTFFYPENGNGTLLTARSEAFDMQFNASREVNSLCLGANLTAPDNGEALRNIMDEMLRLKDVPIKVIDMNSRGFEDIKGTFEHDFDIRRSDNAYGGEFTFCWRDQPGHTKNLPTKPQR